MDWSSYMYISPCVVSVMAAAAADFPGFPKPYTAANLKTKPSGGDSSYVDRYHEIFETFG